MSIKIVADSTCDLPQDIIKKYDIQILPLGVIMHGELFFDGVNICPDDIYAEVDKTGVLPKTSAVSPKIFHDTFEKILNNGDEVLVYTISKELSSVYQSALLARTEIPNGEEKIKIIDSETLSSGQGLQILMAQRLINEGKTLEEVYAQMILIPKLVVAQFVTCRFDYLYKGGRCNGMAFLFGTSLKIKPIIKVVDGKMKVYKLTRGNVSKGIDVQYHDFESDLKKDNVELETIMITHSKATAEAEALKERLSKIVDEKIIVISDAGSVISSHCGPGTIGLLYIRKK